ncbi:MAG: hypothetical protein PVI92_10680 [Chromatiales bacterium]
MTRIRIISTAISRLLLPALLLQPLTLFAANQTTTASSYVGVTALNFDYEEFDDQGISLDREQGWLPGMTAGFTYAAQAWHFGGNLRWASATADYTSPEADTTTDEELLDLSLYVDTPLITRNDHRLHLRIGGGYHKWWRDIRSTDFILGLDETYHWKYALIGLHSEHRIDSQTTLTTDIHLHRVFSPKISVNFLQSYDPVDLSLEQENGFRLSLGLNKALGEGFLLQISPWYEYWELGRSADADLFSNGVLVGSVFEPRSETRGFGIDLRLCWQFDLN